MTALLRTWGRALVAVWPTVLAWYLAGTLVREGVLSLAAPIGVDAPLAAFLLLPLAVLARLVSYVGMFLAVRRAMPAANLIAGREPVQGRAAFQGFVDILLAAIVPFFVLYGSLGLIQNDLESYANRAARIVLFTDIGLGFLRPGDGPLVVAVIVVAFLGRLAIKRFGDRLPRWMGLVEVYLEATWIFVAVSGIVASFGSVVSWVQSRQVVQLVLEARQALRELWTPVRLAIDGIDGLVPILLQLVALPLAWLLIAGIVYTRDLASVAEERVLSRRLEARLRAGLARIPVGVARQRHLVTDEWDDVYKPLTVAGRLALRSGWRPVGLFVALWALLAAAQLSVLWAATRLVGAQTMSFWLDNYSLLSISVAAIAEVLRVCLLAAVFDGALAAWSRRRGVAAPDEARAAVAVPASAPTASAAGGEVEPNGLDSGPGAQLDVDRRGVEHP